MFYTFPDNHAYEPWNKGKLLGQKLPLKLIEIWDIRVRLDSLEMILAIIH